MADQALPILDTYAQVCAAERADTIAYFRKRRAACAARYLTAQLWDTRRRARADVLHYGRLIRGMQQ